jgi:hypothetical protein
LLSAGIAKLYYGSDANRNSVSQQLNRMNGFWKKSLPPISKLAHARHSVSGPESQKRNLDHHRILSQRHWALSPPAAAQPMSFTFPGCEHFRCGAALRRGYAAIRGVIYRHFMA